MQRRQVPSHRNGCFEVEVVVPGQNTGRLCVCCRSGLLGRVNSPSQGLCLHRTTQHRKTRTNIHALSGIRTHDPRNQPAKTNALDRTLHYLLLLSMSSSRRQPNHQKKTTEIVIWHVKISKNIARYRLGLL
jgi:hypothetical protein